MDWSGTWTKFHLNPHQHVDWSEYDNIQSCCCRPVAGLARPPDRACVGALVLVATRRRATAKAPLDDGRRSLLLDASFVQEWSDAQESPQRGRVGGGGTGEGPRSRPGGLPACRMWQQQLAAFLLTARAQGPQSDRRIAHPRGHEGFV